MRLLLILLFLAAVIGTVITPPMALGDGSDPMPLCRPTKDHPCPVR